MKGICSVLTILCLCYGIDHTNCNPLGKNNDQNDDKKDDKSYAQANARVQLQLFELFYESWTSIITENQEKLQTTAAPNGKTSDVYTVATDNVTVDLQLQDIFFETIASKSANMEQIFPVFYTKYLSLTYAETFATGALYYEKIGDNDKKLLCQNVSQYFYLFSYTKTTTVVESMSSLISDNWQSLSSSYTKAIEGHYSYNDFVLYERIVPLIKNELVYSDYIMQYESIDLYTSLVETARINTEESVGNMNSFINQLVFPPDTSYRSVTSSHWETYEITVEVWSQAEYILNTVSTSNSLTDHSSAVQMIQYLEVKKLIWKEYITEVQYSELRSSVQDTKFIWNGTDPKDSTAPCPCYFGEVSTNDNKPTSKSKKLNKSDDGKLSSTDSSADDIVISIEFGPQSGANTSAASSTDNADLTISVDIPDLMKIIMQLVDETKSQDGKAGADKQIPASRNRDHNQKLNKREHDANTLDDNEIKNEPSTTPTQNKLPITKLNDTNGKVPNTSARQLTNSSQSPNNNGRTAPSEPSPLSMFQITPISDDGTKSTTSFFPLESSNATKTPDVTAVGFPIDSANPNKPEYSPNNESANHKKQNKDSTNKYAPKSQIEAPPSSTNADKNPNNSSIYPNDPNVAGGAYVQPQSQTQDQGLENLINGIIAALMNQQTSSDNQQTPVDNQQQQQTPLITIGV